LQYRLCWHWLHKKLKHKPKASNAAIRDKVGVKIGVISAAIKDKEKASGGGRTH
jgi:hypothetical protein